MFIMSIYRRNRWRHSCEFSRLSLSFSAQPSQLKIRVLLRTVASCGSFESCNIIFFLCGKGALSGSFFGCRRNRQVCCRSDTEILVGQTTHFRWASDLTFLPDWGWRVKDAGVRSTSSKECFQNRLSIQIFRNGSGQAQMQQQSYFVHENTTWIWRIVFPWSCCSKLWVGSAAIIDMCVGRTGTTAVHTSSDTPCCWT